MPNRAPVVLDAMETAALIECMPPPMDLRDAEDAEDRQRIKATESTRQRLKELQASLSSSAAEHESGQVILSIDEIDALLDSVPPPGAPPIPGASPECLAAVRTKLSDSLSVASDVQVGK